MKQAIIFIVGFIAFAAFVFIILWLITLFINPNLWDSNKRFAAVLALGSSAMANITLSIIFNSNEQPTKSRRGCNYRSFDSASYLKKFRRKNS